MTNEDERLWKTQTTFGGNSAAFYMEKRQSRSKGTQRRPSALGERFMKS